MTRSLDYDVRVSESKGQSARLVFTVEPKSQSKSSNGKRGPQYVFSITTEPDAEPAWDPSSDDPGPDRANVVQEIKTRMRARTAWIQRVAMLVGEVDQWARELDWATRRVDKRLEDNRVGTHVVPALLMQKETRRVLLEPLGLSTPGTEGVVDLYLMPAYDDIATLYYYDGKWNVHHPLPIETGATTIRDAPPRPLSKETLAQVLVEMCASAV